MSIKFCRKCILPTTKPDLEFSNDYICQGCKAFEKRGEIDWDKRSSEFEKLLNNFRSKNNNYDCIIPVSGGKDSTFQVIKMLEHNMNPLCVTAMTDKLTDIGRYNLDNIKKLGVDHIEVYTDPVLRRKINKFTLKSVGDISWAEHITIFTIPVRIACKFDIPLIIWGENSQNENGGPEKNENAIKLDRRWLEEFGGLLGLRTTDLNTILGVPLNKLTQYTYPSQEEINSKNITGIFLGYFFPWDGYENFKIAKSSGFKTYEKDLEGSIVNYENLDNAQMRIHDYFKYLKFGYDRVTDWCCWHIRRGRMTRDKAIKININNSGKYPNSYMGFTLNEILSEIDCTEEEFNDICDSFTNKELFKLNNEGNLIKSEDGSLVPNFKMV